MSDAGHDMKLRLALRVLQVAPLVATLIPAGLVVLTLGPRLLSGGSLDAGPNRRIVLDAYMFFGFAAPSVGALTLVSWGIVKWLVGRDRLAVEAGAMRRAGIWGLVALLSALVWLLAFPFMFFATGGTR